MRRFVDQSRRPRVVFGRGTVAGTGEELDRLGATRALVLSTPGRSGLADRVADELGDRVAGRFAKAEMHTPLRVTERGLGVMRELGADSVVSVGGGSTTGLGKAIASRLGVPHLVLPTTYAGSEVTPVIGETADGEKVTRSGPEILPDTVVYDVDLTMNLPWAVTVTSAVNAMAHAVEALYAPDARPDVDAMAVEAIGALTRGLRALDANRADPEARDDLLYGAWQAGSCLGSVQMGLHHKLCHTLGGSFGLPHAPTHAVVLPYAMAYNADAAPVAMSRVAGAMGTGPDAAEAVQLLVAGLEGPTSLGELGLQEEDLDRAVALATARPYPNPREVTPEGVRDLLTRALHGSRIGAPAR
jgi:alcohol dehydrogenase class IV